MRPRPYRPPPAARRAATAGFWALLGLLGGCGGEAETPSLPAAPRAAAPSPAPREEGPWFTEEAEKRGITLLNQTGRPRQKELIMEAVGPGAAAFDANGDGLLDVYIPNGNWLVGDYRDQFYLGEDRPRHALYIQRPDGTFVDEAEARGVRDDAWGFGACAADLDGDGDQDLVVSNLGPNRLYVNDGTGSFTNVAQAAGVEGPSERGTWEWSTGIAVGDYDRDGVLDLYIANYADLFKWMRESPDVERTADGKIVKANVCTWQRLKVYCGPLGLPGQQDHLYRGLGGRDGEIRFRDVTRESGVFRPEDKGGPLYGFQALFTDLTNDGWPDIYVANDSVPSFFFENLRDGTFRECGHELGIAVSDAGEDMAGMGAESADLNDDGWLDVAKTNFAMQTNNLYVAEPIPGGALAFRDYSLWTGLKEQVYTDLGWMVLLFDYDNDADKDIFFANGHVYPEVDSKPDLGTSFDQFNKLFRNVSKPGELRFELGGRELGPGFEVRKCSRGGTLWDFDNDGDLDILVMNLNNTPDLLVNRRGNANGHWLRLAFAGNTAKRVNREAIGSRVRVTAGGKTQHFETKRGQGFLGSIDPRLHVGLGAHTGAVEIEVTWPNGETSTHTVEGVDRDASIAQP